MHGIFEFEEECVFQYRIPLLILNGFYFSRGFISIWRHRLDSTVDFYWWNHYRLWIRYDLLFLYLKHSAMRWTALGILKSKLFIKILVSKDTFFANDYRIEHLFCWKSWRFKLYITTYENVTVLRLRSSPIYKIIHF